MPKIVIAGKDRFQARATPSVTSSITTSRSATASAVIADTERLARVIGEGFAGSIAAEPSQLALVDVHSAKDLAITAPGVTATRLNGGDAAYRCRYSGLLRRSGEKYLLSNDGRTRETGRILLLGDSGDIRLELRPSARALPRTASPDHRSTA